MSYLGTRPPRLIGVILPSFAAVSGLSLRFSLMFLAELLWEEALTVGTFSMPDIKNRFHKIYIRISEHL